MNLTRYSRDTENYLPGKLNDLQNHTANFREIEIPVCMPPIIHSNIQNIENHMQHFNHELALLLAAPAHYSGDFTADVYGPVQAGLDEATDAVDQFVRTKYMNSNTGEEN